MNRKTVKVRRADASIVVDVKYAGLFRKQECRANCGQHFAVIYPPLNRWINMPFKVEIGENGSSVATHRLRMVEEPHYTRGSGKGMTRSPALWECVPAK